jgi:hypothetical protein
MRDRRSSSRRKGDLWAVRFRMARVAPKKGEVFEERSHPDRSDGSVPRRGCWPRHRLASRKELLSWAVAWTAPSRSLLGQIPALDGDPRNFEPPFAPRHRRQRSAPASCSRPRARSALIARSVPGGSSDSAGRNRSSVSRIYANSNFNRLRRKLVMEPMEWGQTLAIDQPFSDRAWAWQTKALPLSSLAAPSSALSWASSSPSPLPIYEPGAPITWR